MNRMNLTDKDYELIARWLDGEPIELTEDQLAVAREISAQSKAVVDAIDVPIPPGVLHRVNVRLKQALKSRKQQRGRKVAYLVAAAAIVIVVISTAIFLLHRPGEVSHKSRIYHPEAGYTAAVDYTDEDAIEAKIEQLSQELDDYSVELVVEETFPDEIVFAGIEDEIQDVILGEDDPSSSFILVVPQDLSGTDLQKDNL